MRGFFRYWYTFLITLSILLFSTYAKAVGNIPSNVTAVASSSTSILVSWSDPSNQELSFKLQRSTSPTFSSGIVTVSAALAPNTTSKLVTGLSASTTYYFRVRAKYSIGNSVYSNIVSATTPSTSGGSSVAAPTGFTGTAASTTTINLSWSYSTGTISNFSIDRALDANFSNIQHSFILDPVYRNFQIGLLTAGTTYYFRIRANASGGSSAWVSSGAITTLTASGTAPNAISNLSATSISTSQINLTWTDSSNETSYVLERATNSAFSSGLTTVSPAPSSNSSSYSVTGLSASTTYYFRIRAINSYGTSGNSNSASATTQTVSGTAPSAPSSLSGSASSSSQINLTWVDNSNNETSFTLDRATNSQFTSNLVSSSHSAGATSVSVTGLSASTTYYFRIKANNSYGSSAWVSSSAITTQASTSIPTITWYEGSKQSVPLYADIQSSPAQITLRWANISGRSVSSINIYRKLKTASSWGTAIASPSASSNSYTDTSMSSGIDYEYQVVMSTNAGTAYGYISSGIQVDLPMYRGKLLLYIDSEISSGITTAKNQLVKDLVGDGWIVVERVIDHYSSPSTVRNQVISDYNSDTSNVKALYILGNLAIARSGVVFNDGHGAHQGHWPSDAFYADVNGTWTDSTKDFTNGANNFFSNHPGDGRFDQDDIPSTVELQVGRVDLKNMDAFWPNGQSSPEIWTYNNYLNKAHTFKTAGYVPSNQGRLVDNFTGYQFSQSGFNNLSALLGPTNFTRVSMIEDTSLQPFYQMMNNQNYLWTYACNGGGYDKFTAPNQYIAESNTWNMASVNYGSVFNMSFGSYFGDWDYNNSFLRAFISGGKGLTNVWAGIPHWYFHQMGMGENIGLSVKASMNNKINNTYLPLYGGSAGGTQSNIQMALMGDPSLRMKYVAPPTGASVQAVGSTLSFSWSHSSQNGSAGFQGYNIYEKQSNGFRKVNTNIITGNSFASSDAATSGRIYIIRAVKLETSNSGTYNNMSIGAYLNY